METLFNAIKIVHAGGGYITDYALGIIQKKLNVDLAADNDAFTKLTNIENKVLWYISQFKTIEETASILFLSPNTINNHLANIRKKLDLKGNHSLLKYVVLSKYKGEK